MKINKEIYIEILNQAAQVYPNPLSPFEYLKISNDEHVIAANIKYLEEHNFIKNGSLTIGGSGKYMFFPLTMTAIAADNFYLKENGLSDILNVLTVRFDPQAIKDLISSSVSECTELPQDQKKSLLDGLQELPSESIKHLTTRLLDAGIDNSSAMIDLLRKFFQNYF